MIFAEFNEFSDKKESKGFDRMTSVVANEHLKHSTSKSHLTDMIFKLTLIHASLIFAEFNEFTEFTSHLGKLSLKINCFGITKRFKFVS